MKNTTKDNLQYCKELIKKLSYDRYLECVAFATGTAQAQLIALYALDAELKHVRHAVTEEMLGHIRYAWWYESVEALEKPREHPVLKALQETNPPREGLLSLVNAYREAYPEIPGHIDEQLDDVAASLLPEKQRKRHLKALQLIRAHQGGRLMLLVKLLFV